MKHILLSCVNYNSYNELVDYLQSINEAAEQAKEVVRIDVLISDNSIKKTIINASGYTSINCRIFLNENIGYLGGALSSINQSDVSQYDFVIISNVDLKLSVTFFLDVINSDLNNIGWITPRIFTPKTHKDENPFMIERPSKIKLMLQLLLYKQAFIYSLYAYFSKFRHRERKHLAKQPSCKIYAGHGSLMIFTKSFIMQNLNLEFPAFMYGEEIFFAELLRLSHLETIYVPNIYVENIGKVSTRLLSYKRLCSMNLESLSKLRKMYFNS